MKPGKSFNIDFILSLKTSNSEEYKGDNDATAASSKVEQRSNNNRLMDEPVTWTGSPTLTSDMEASYSTRATASNRETSSRKSTISTVETRCHVFLSSSTDTPQPRVSDFVSPGVTTTLDRDRYVKSVTATSFHDVVTSQTAGGEVQMHPGSAFHHPAPSLVQQEMMLRLQMLHASRYHQVLQSRTGVFYPKIINYNCKHLLAYVTEHIVISIAQDFTQHIV